MSTYADASALVKLYRDEDGSELARELEEVVVSQLSRVEVPAALWAAHVRAGLPRHAVESLVGAFEADYYGDEAGDGRFAVLLLTDQVLETAALLAGRYGLRAYDAVQLAGAVHARAADRDCRTMAVFDRRLAAAARDEGFRTVPAA